MKSLFTSALALVLAAGLSGAAYAHGGHGGGGGYVADPAHAKALAVAAAQACAANSDKCVGFGTHYYGQ